ncbi:NAD(P)/FAD-dependent oxidoreductase [Thiomicrorhabdus sp.]|uniref:NAD(P)/FAD-dependent oxidoreductase n=1 Tax=Thiomicrorhabdus sp. TaxID=2039724 RepID=UPI0029C715DD|nr:NAD(P)/FAD-dependent oxidoreductase [Thiomicrorhabdus sp.]
MKEEKQASTAHSVAEIWDVIVVGAGAAGLMCSATAGYRGKRVLVIDHAPKAAAKIRISGGGKCNFTNVNAAPENYICSNPHFVKSALSRYPSHEFIDLADRHGLEYEERELGKLFCSNRASDLIQILRTECDWAQVEFALKTEIEKVISLEGEGFRLSTSQGDMQCRKLVIASGALSFPKLKASDFGYRTARQFGLNVIATRPGLVPLNFSGKWLQRFSDLAGLSLDVRVSCRERSFQEAMLFTHQGLSGPAILQISNYWRHGDSIEIDLLPNLDVLSELKAIRQQNSNFHHWLNTFWPKRFTQMWLNLYPAPGRLSNAGDEALETLAEQLQRWSLYPSEDGGYDKAEVTLGGVDTDEISSKTFESKRCANLYFIGEVLDVTGQLGGYNFQWAWASAVACGNAL